MNSKNRWQQVLRGVVAVLSLALLVSCGGGKRQAFKPGHMYTFGDEYSYIDINQASASNNTYARYSVNVVSLVSPITVYSSIYPATWTQYVSSHYGKDIAPCASTASAQMSLCSVPGQTVADTINTINTKSFQKDELVVIMAGTRDILNAYQSFKSDPSNIATYAANAKQAGINLAQKINAIVTTGARVAVATIPDIGLSPYAISEAGGVGNLRNYSQAMDCDATYQPGTGEYSKALSYLTACFNYGLRGTNGIVNDGKKIALISTFDWSILIARSPSSYSIADALDPACATTYVPHSTAATYTPALCYIDAGDTNTSRAASTTAVAYPSTYMWSFGPWLAPGGHALLGSRAVNQVNLNWGE